MSPTTSCPCGSGLAFEACCRPRHLGIRPAETAEALMRSRYAAFVRGEVAYLVKTLHPSKRDLSTAATLRGTISSTRWTGLRVLETEAGTSTDDAGQVEFVAFFEQRGVQNGAKGQLHERSLFQRSLFQRDEGRDGGRWVYVDAVPVRCRPPARGAPCWCGSGERYRRCHGG